MTLWPSSQDAWNRLAADLLARKRAEATAHWEAQRAEQQEDADLHEPLSPEEEETLF